MASDKAKHRGRPREFDRQQALERALKIFWEKGFEPASVAELCCAMEINPPSLYAAFGNKSALFLEAARQYERTYWAAPNKALMEEADVYKAIREYFDSAARILLSPDAPCGCLVTLGAINISSSEVEIISELKKLRNDMRNLFAERLRIAIKAGQIPPDTDVPALSGALNALLEGLALQARQGLFLSELKAMAAFAPRLLPPPAPAERPKMKAAPLTLL
ncbi:MAG: TetR/AcrR family transcriptional regulator [Desulfovibrio sp.]|nr:TetR/AcrR family transcriptional regulator [Desulfovibrio sp.]